MKIVKRQVAKVLREAAKTIDKYGLHKGWFGSEEMGFCAIGSISYAAHGRSTHVTADGIDFYAREAFRKRLDAAYGRLGISRFNDEDSTTKDDIAGLMRRTARELEHGGEL